MRTKYLLPCSCGKKTPIEVTQAGETIRCACGAELEVPPMREITALEEVVPETEAQRPSASGGWGRREAWILFGLVVFISGVSLLGWLQWSQPRLSNVQAMSPLESWALWQELRLGANRDPSPPAKAFAKALTSNRNWTVVAVGLLVVGLTVTIGSFATRKSRPTS